MKNSISKTNISKFNKDFKKSVDLVVEKIKNNEKICILGDYDVDGSCSTALLIKFLSFLKRLFTKTHRFSIPVIWKPSATFDFTPL